MIDVSDPRLVAASEIDVLHIHWPEKVFWDGGSFPRVIARLIRNAESASQAKTVRRDSRVDGSQSETARSRNSIQAALDVLPFSAW